MSDDVLSVRALRTRQKADIDVYAFFLPGALITEIADISRVERDAQNHLRGFQRKEIRNHVRSIVEYLDQGEVLFPNAIILALAANVEFKQSRGPSPQGLLDAAQSGTLFIPRRATGQRLAWIVDGQQRSLALAKCQNTQLPVPVIAFVSPDLETQREQFILVNKAKPLPSRLIDELLPEVGIALPRDLSARRLPSELCNLLNRDPQSPFFQLIKRMSDENSAAVVMDSALEAAIQRNIKTPIGALNQYRGLGNSSSDIPAMYTTLVTFWSAVRDVFPDAWGKPPTQSRLMHSAGIRSMGALMDPIMLRADGASDPRKEITAALQRVRPYCHWISGTWDGLGWGWDEIQSTPVHISKLTDYLCRIERETARKTL